MSRVKTTPLVGLLYVFSGCLLTCVASCSPSSSSGRGRYPTGGDAPGIRNSSSVAPCPKTSEKSGLTSSPLNLNLPEIAAKSADAGSFESGGYISVRFFGVPTGLEKFKSPMEDAEGRISYGNPKGVIDVLNTPYCSQSATLVDQTRIKRCVSRSTWKQIQNDDVAIKKILLNWNPEQFYKTCTALVSVDKADLRFNTKSSSSHRLRIWTAEHCFQPSYSTEVYLNLSAPSQKKDYSYVSMKLNSVDGLEYVKSIVSKKGRGDDFDPLLRQKLFILRSLDGRSAETYQSAIHEGCLKRGETIRFSDNSTKAKNVDCFTAADLSTFKATVNIDTFSQRAPIGLMSSERTLDTETLRARRESVLNKINKKAADADTLLESLLKNTMDSQSFDSNARKQFTGFFSGLPSEVQSVFSFGEMIRSQMDGIQQARRYEAMQYELSAGGVGQGLSKEDLDDVLYDKFKVLKLNFGGADLFSEISGALNQLLPGIGDIACSISQSKSCPTFIMSPPGTAELEEFLLGQSNSLNNYLSKRLQVLLLGLSNERLPANHPFRITSADSDATANIKMGAIWTRVIFESATMRKEPFRESAFYNGISKLFQRTIFEMCPSADFAGRMFPVVGNLNIGNTKHFGSASILGGSRSLKILPVVGSGVSVPEFNEIACGPGKNSEVVTHLGDPVQVNGSAMPVEPIVGLDADDSVLNSSPETAAYEYMTRRVVYKFAGASGGDLRVAGPMDSGMAWTFLGFGLLVLSSHNGQLTNGAVFVEMPDVNTPDPDAGAPVDSQGRPIVTCMGQ